VAALHQGAPAQKIHVPPWLMTSLENPPLWLLLCFGSVIVWTENENVTISDRFICFILTVKQLAALHACVLRATTKKGRQLSLRKSASGDLAWGFSDLEITWFISLLRWRLHLMTCRKTLVTRKWPGCLDVLAPPLFACANYDTYILTERTRNAKRLERRQVA